MCVFVYLNGDSHGKESKEKTTWPRLAVILNRSKRESFLREKEKREKRVRVCWLFRGLSTPANEKLLRIFHHTRESFLDIPFVKWKCVLCRRE